MGAGVGLNEDTRVWGRKRVDKQWEAGKTLQLRTHSAAVQGHDLCHGGSRQRPQGGSFCFIYSMPPMSYSSYLFKTDYLQVCAPDHDTKHVFGEKKIVSMVFVR